MIRRGANVEVVVLRKPGELADQVRELGVPVTVLGNRGGLFDFRGVRKLAKWLKANKPDIVQSSQFLTNLHTRLACMLSRSPIHIIEEHGIYTWKKWYHRAIDRRINSRAQGVIACSHQVAKSAAGDLGISVDRITVIHNCVAQHHLEKNEMTEEDRNEFRSELVGDGNGLDSDSRLVGIVGTLRWEKGHSFLFEAWKALHEKKLLNGSDYLIVVGDGPLRTKLEEQASSTVNIRFIGSSTETRKILRCLDLFVLPSLNEGFGIAIIEAMAAGIPVISTQSGGIPEILDREGIGILTQPEDVSSLEAAIADIVEGSENGRKIGLNGRKTVHERFTPAIYVQQLEGIYGLLLTGER